MWVHAFPERRFRASGYHIPQIIIPQHNSDDMKWQDLLDYREGKENYTDAKFYNEICGIPYDGSSRLITLTELRKACKVPTSVYNLQGAADYVKAKIRDGTYVDVILSIDWGGGGAKELSFTTITVACLRYDGKIDIPYAFRSLSPHNHEKEIATIIALKRLFKVSKIVHDGNGAGEARETQLKMCGFPQDLFVRMFYVRLSRGHIMKFRPGDSRTGELSGWNLDKARGLMWLISLIKQGFIKFFEYDTKESGKLGLVDDFLSLIEDKHSQII
jgi:hypothetical protein